MPLAAQAQRKSWPVRYWNKLVNDTTDIRRPQFLMYPTVAYAPETSWEFGLSSVYVFYARRDTANRLSEVNGFTFFTLQRQYGLWFDHALYANKNNWFNLGRVRLQSFPLLYYGIGAATPSEPAAQVDANLIQIKERMLRKVIPNLYAGVEVDYQRMSSVNFISKNESPVVLPIGHEGATNIALGSGILYDSRHNILNVRDGFFSELALLRYSKTWGSDYAFTTIISDTRFFKSINKRDVLAFQTFGQFNIGQPPFNQLALMGGESIMRGYYQGRYRDKNLVAAQVEYRLLPLPWQFSKRWGAAFFAGSGTVYNRANSFSSRDIVWAAGGGIRFLLFPKKDVFTRLDFAFTKEGSGIYIFIGEAF
jgi:hypothetical protein